MIIGASLALWWACSWMGNCNTVVPIVPCLNSVYNACRAGGKSRRCRFCKSRQRLLQDRVAWKYISSYRWIEQTFTSARTADESQRGCEYFWVDRWYGEGKGISRMYAAGVFSHAFSVDCYHYDKMQRNASSRGFSGTMSKCRDGRTRKILE